MRHSWPQSLRVRPAAAKAPRAFAAGGELMPVVGERMGVVRWVKGVWWNVVRSSAPLRRRRAPASKAAYRLLAGKEGLAARLLELLVAPKLLTRC